jgi:hypothetical protein
VAVNDAILPSDIEVCDEDTLQRHAVIVTNISLCLLPDHFNNVQAVLFGNKQLVLLDLGSQSRRDRRQKILYICHEDPEEE